ncbi:zinc finger protein 106-like isoform X2 [Lytechinus variegatus]|uniref:zinc finger protein 106-like isoform X2 n=1 Tax=Lytechinus variegatus TaxID=7654 RepID=UPI001BB2AAC2|nr:zinc finger protein 106-like isoform X2 [Lytechinus variegatus]
MDEKTEKEKQKFVCKLCSLDYPSSIQFEEHLWSMLHHKAINNKSNSTKHHCNLCMFETYKLNEYAKHLIGEKHKKSLVERRKRLEDAQMVKPSTTSVSKKLESQVNQRQTDPNQTFPRPVYPQRRGSNTFHETSSSNVGYQEPSTQQQNHNSFPWHPPFRFQQQRFEQPRYEHTRFGSPNIERFRCNQRPRYGNPKFHYPPRSGPYPRLESPWVGNNRFEPPCVENDRFEHGNNNRPTAPSMVPPWVQNSGFEHGNNRPNEPTSAPPRFEHGNNRPTAPTSTPPGIENSRFERGNKPTTPTSAPPDVENSGFERRNNKPTTPTSAPPGVTNLRFDRGNNRPMTPTSAPRGAENARLQSGNRPVFNPKRKIPISAQTVKNKKNPKLHANADKQKRKENNANLKEDTVKVLENTKKQMQHSGASREVPTPSSTLNKQSGQHARGNQLHSNTLSVPNVKVVKGHTTSKSPKIKKKNKPSLQKKFHDMQGSTGNSQKTDVGKVEKKNKSKMLLHQSSVVSRQSPMKDSTKTSQHSSSCKGNDNKRTPQKADSETDRFERNLRDALNGKRFVSSDEMVTSSKKAVASEKYGKSSTFGPTCQTQMVSSSVARVSNFKKPVNKHIRFEDMPCQSNISASSEEKRDSSKIPNCKESSTTGKDGQDMSPSQGKTDRKAQFKDSRNKKSGKVVNDGKTQSHMDNSTRNPSIENTNLISSTGKSKEQVSSRSGVTDKCNKVAPKISSFRDSSNRGGSVQDNRPCSCTKNKKSKHKEFVMSDMESSESNGYDHDTSPISSTVTTDRDLVLKEQVRSTMTETASIDVPSISSSSSPVQNSEQNTGNQSLLSAVGQKVNPRPNVAKARSRLRTKDAEQTNAGQAFKEKIQGLLSDVAKPVWQQKKIHMLLAKAKKAPDRFKRFSHLTSSPSRSEDPIDDIDIMNLSTEFQQELLDLIQSEDADEEDILSQLTGMEGNESNLQEAVGGDSLALLFEQSEQNADALIGDIQEVLPLMNQQRLNKGKAVTSDTPAIKVEPPETLGSEQLLHEKQSLPGTSSMGSTDTPEQPSSDMATNLVQSQELSTGQSPQSSGSRRLEEAQDAEGSSERHDTSVTSTSAISSIDSVETSGKKGHKKKKEKKKKSKKSKSKKVDVELTKKQRPKLKTPKTSSVRRKSVQSTISEKANRRTNSPTILTATKIKKKVMQRRKMLDTGMVGDTCMDNLLDITIQEQNLQLKMDKLNSKIDKLYTIIQEKEALLKSFKQEKEVVINSLSELRDKRLNLLLGLTSSEKISKSVSSSSSHTGNGPSSSSHSNSLQTDTQETGISDVLSEALQSGGEGDIVISNVMSMAQETPSEGFRIMLRSPARNVSDQSQGTMDTFGDVGHNQNEQSIDIGSSQQSLAGQSIEVVPQVMSRESLAKTLQELSSCGSGIKVDIVSSDEDTLYGIDCKQLMHGDSQLPGSDVIGAVAKLMSPDTDRVTQSVELSSLSDIISEQHHMFADCAQVRNNKERIPPFPTDNGESTSEIRSPHNNVTSSENSIMTIKQEPSDNDEICQKQDYFEPYNTKRKRLNEVSEDTQAKRLKNNQQDTTLPGNVQEPGELQSAISFTDSVGSNDTSLSQMRNVTSVSDASGSKDSIPDTSGTLQTADGNPEEQKPSSPHSKGYVISMCIIADKLYACISDSRFIIFNLATNKIDAEEDLALRNIKNFELWRDSTANKMVAFASNGSRNLVQFDVQRKEFLQTMVLQKEVSCLHLKWNSLYAGLVNGEIANINVQKSRVTWYYDCTPTFAVTAIASTLEGGIKLLITASKDRTVTIRQANDGLLLRSLEGHIDVVTDFQVLGSRVLSKARNNTIFIHDLDTGDVIHRVKHQTKIACCVMSGDTLAVAGHTGNVYYYKIMSDEVDIFDSGCGTITCMTASQDMVFLGIEDGFIDVIPLHPSTVYPCEWSHCISRFLRLDALKTHLQFIHIRRSARQCLWKSCLKNYPHNNTTIKAIEQHVFSHLKDLKKGGT